MGYFWEVADDKKDGNSVEHFYEERSENRRKDRVPKDWVVRANEEEI